MTEEQTVESLEEFLTTIPPMERVVIPTLLQFHPDPLGPIGGTAPTAPQTPEPLAATPETLRLPCSSDTCEDDERIFEVTSGQVTRLSGAIPRTGDTFLGYRCRHCRDSTKVFAVHFEQSLSGGLGSTRGYAMKYGEDPHFGPPVPRRALQLIDPDRDLFLKGYAAERRGLGIGAFAYYRRVVETQKGRLIEEMERAAKALGAKPEALQLFEQARVERQFGKAVKMIKDAVPPQLLIDGHNPLTLLHPATSEGLHELSDEECLALATGVRTVLIELAERIQRATRDRTALQQSVGTLLNRPGRTRPVVPPSRRRL